MEKVKSNPPRRRYSGVPLALRTLLLLFPPGRAPARRASLHLHPLCSPPLRSLKMLRFLPAKLRVKFMKAREQGWLRIICLPYPSATTVATEVVGRTLCTILCSAFVMTGPAHVGAIVQKLSWSIRSLCILLASAVLALKSKL